ncbi:hypothetical protein [Bradyrhizobium zhanjiangense]|uniref:Uncharacterized protein n=1 Tax=Bradyrhizobium zhanjiangense TaxID=1325107 RepID=A0A4Q0SJU8_9BRAD|nr:hypothetical protein [Bradyrhizobium zhanjiangense]RXH37956.1 hypothetical protein XH94_23845 [Bradyrhizobium zhanjiangense]
MTEHRINLRMPYHQAYRLYRGRRDLGVRLTEIAPIVVREIDASEAPVAYRIHTQDDYVADRLHEVRSFQSACWWPLMAHDGQVGVGRFIDFAGKGKLGSFLSFDEPPRMGQRDGRMIEEYAREFPTHHYGENDKEHQLLLTARGAARLLFCDGYVYVNVGPPVWYVEELPAVGRIDVWLGHETFDRDKTNVWTAGPDRHMQRYSYESCGVYGLGEIETELERLAEPRTEVRVRSQIETVLDLEVPERTARLCARNLFESIRRFCHDERLCAAAPLLAETVRMKTAPTDSDLFRVLEQFSRLRDRTLLQSYRSSIEATRDIIRRLETFGCTPLAQEDEDALAALGS